MGVGILSGGRRGTRCVGLPWRTEGPWAARLRRRRRIGGGLIQPTKGGLGARAGGVALQGALHQLVGTVAVVGNGRQPQERLLVKAIEGQRGLKVATGALVVPALGGGNAEFD